MPQKPSPELTNFIEAAKLKGISDEFLTTLLIQQGWPRDEVLSALGDYWERFTGISLPVRAGRSEGSRDAFLYLLSFATLATWASALGSMIFRFIDYWFPDPVAPDRFYNLRSAVTWQMASTTVAFPIFLLVMRTILREAQHQPERLQSGVRKWLTYIALLLTAGGLISDLIWFVGYFLTGELTIRFVLKAGTVLLICAAIFAYYLGSLRWDKDKDLGPARSPSLRLRVIAAAVVVGALCIGLGVTGTPSMQRHLEADKRRVQDLRAIANAIHLRFTRSRNSLPSSLTELSAYGIDNSRILDPETKAQYSYKPRTGTTYELCGVFSAASERDQMPQSGSWYHGQGQTCYTLDSSLQPSW